MGFLFLVFFKKINGIFDIGKNVEKKNKVRKPSSPSLRPHWNSWDLLLLLQLLSFTSQEKAAAVPKVAAAVIAANISNAFKEP